MFGIGSTELLVILLVALMVLGPKKLAGFSQKLGRLVGEVRRVSTDFQRTLNAEAAADEAAAKKAAMPKQQASAAADLDPDSPLAQALNRAEQQAKSNDTVKQDQSGASS